MRASSSGGAGGGKVYIGNLNAAFDGVVAFAADSSSFTSLSGFNFWIVFTLAPSADTTVADPEIVAFVDIRGDVTCACEGSGGSGRSRSARSRSRLKPYAAVPRPGGRAYG